MAYDAAHGEIVMFGGLDQSAHTLFNETWVWGGANWTRKLPAHSPSARIDHTVVFDTVRNQIVLFGGFGYAGELADTWVWDGTDWTQESPSANPPARQLQAMAYDKAHGQAVMFGGLVTTPLALLGDTWLWGGSTGSCQVNVTKLYQAVNASGMVQPWACDLYNHTYGTQSSRYCPAIPALNRIAQVGCALTALTMSLDTAGLSFDPGTLNSFMLQPQNAFDYGQDHGVSFDTTVNDAAIFSGKTLNWTWFTSTSTHDLQNTVCSASAPVIVGVDLSLNQVNQPVPGHYVLVTGWDGAQFQIADPGYPSRTSLSAYGNQFVGAGYVTDPQNARSSLHISVTDAELVATDPNGLKSGFDVTSSQDLNQIPGSAYSRSKLVNDETGQPASQVGYYLDIHQPADGAYTIIVQGLKLETYDLTVRVFDANGNPEPPLSVVGIAAPGSRQTLSIQSASSVGAISTVGVVATFQNTLADIQNSLALGLIDNMGIASSLSQKIEAALAATGTTRSNILNAFKNEVRALSGKHITGIAPQVLLQNADSLFH
jgi:hypothetical protein